RGRGVVARREPAAGAPRLRDESARCLRRREGEDRRDRRQRSAHAADVARVTSPPPYRSASARDLTMFLNLGGCRFNTVSFSSGPRTLLAHGGWTGTWDSPVVTAGARGCPTRRATRRRLLRCG